MQGLGGCHSPWMDSVKLARGKWDATWAGSLGLPPGAVRITSAYTVKVELKVPPLAPLFVRTVVVPVEAGSASYAGGPAEKPGEGDLPKLVSCPSHLSTVEHLGDRGRGE